MGFSKTDLDYIYRKTNGYCHLCGKKVCRINHGKSGRRGAWHVEHSNPLARGGTNYYRNLFPACIRCNLDKGTRTGKSYKASVGQYSPPRRPGGSDLGDLIVFGLTALEAIS